MHIRTHTHMHMDTHTHTQAELEGHPDIHLTLTTPPGGLPLDHLVVHPCVQSADVSGPSPSGTAENSRKIRFSAPLETFTLCHYQVSCLPYLPIRGFYQMKVRVMIVVVGGVRVGLTFTAW